MNDELRELLRDADGGPVGEGDLEAVVSRARATRVTRVAMVVLLGVLGVGAVLAVGAGFLADEPDVRFSEPDEPPEDGVVDDDDVDGTGVDGDGVGESEPGGELSDDGTGAAVCELPKLRPTTLPWLADGEAVPDPDETMVMAEGAGAHWFAEWNAGAASGAGVLVVSVGVTDLYEPGDEAGTNIRAVAVRGAAGILVWGGDPGESVSVSVQWREAPGACGVHVVSVLTRGDGAGFLGPDFQEGGRCEDAAADDNVCTARYQQAMEALVLEVVASLDALPAGEGDVATEEEPDPPQAADDPADGCELPDLRPRQLPWVEAGEEVPEPDESHLIEGGSYVAWLGDGDAAAAPDQAWHGPAVALFRLADPDAGPDGTERPVVEVLGQPGVLSQIGPPRSGVVRVTWRHELGPCGVYVLEAPTSGDWSPYLDEPFGADHECYDPARDDVACRDTFQRALEALVVHTAGWVGVTGWEAALEGESTCAPPALRPTTLPWVNQGEAVPDPVAVGADETGASANWPAPGLAPDSREGPHVSVRVMEHVLREPALDPGGIPVEVRGTNGTMWWSGGRGIAFLNLSWRESDGPCGIHMVSLWTTGDWQPYLGPDFQGDGPCAQAADGTEDYDLDCRDAFADQMEAIALEIAESLEPE